MKAFEIGSNGIKRANPPLPKAKTGQALLKIQMAGICNTDIELFKGYYGFSGIAGHEFVGTVEQSPGSPTLPGRRVVCDINIGCGKCSCCLKNDPRHCQDRKVIGIKNYPGAFAQYLLVPQKNLHLVPESVSDLEAVFTEPLAAALEITQQIHITNQDNLLIMGDGKLGLLCALGLKNFTSKLLLVGKHQAKLDIAKKQGVNTQLLTKKNTYAQLRKEYGLFDTIVEATGSAQGINQALEMVRPEGTIVAKTTSHKPSTINLAQLVVNEIKLTGSRCGDTEFALNFLKNKLVDVKPLIHKIFPFDDFKSAFDLAQKHESGKIIIDYSEA